MSKNFYDLDYLIELNEKRLEDFNGHYNRVIDKYSIPIIIYSAVAIFLVPVIQHEIENDFKTWVFHVCFAAFCILFGFSIYFFIRLLTPAYKAYLKSPREYYITFRQQYEAQHIMPAGQPQVNDQLKASYINELESAIENTSNLFARKSHFYFNALIYAFLCVLPFLVCLGFHFSRREDKPYKVQIVEEKAVPLNHKNYLYVPDNSKYDSNHQHANDSHDQHLPATGDAKRAGH